MDRVMFVNGWCVCWGWDGACRWRGIRVPGGFGLCGWLRIRVPSVVFSV